MRKAYRFAAGGFHALTFAVVLCFSLLVSCQENRVEELGTLDQNIAHAQQFYQKSQMRLEAKFANKYKLSPDWKNSYLENIDGATSILHVQLASDASTNGVLELVFNDEDSEHLPTQIVEYLPKKGTTKGEKNFDGFVNFYDKHGKFQTGGWIADGEFKMVRIPEEELGNLSNMTLRVNAPEPDGVDLNVVTIIGHRPETPNFYVYINIPLSSFNPSGGNYNGYEYGPAGGTGPGGGGGSEGTATNFPAYTSYGKVKPTSFTFTTLSSTMKKAINKVGLSALDQNHVPKNIFFNIQVNIPSEGRSTPLMQSMAADAATYATKQVMMTATLTFFQAGAQEAVATQFRSFMQIYLTSDEGCGGCQVVAYPNASPATPLDWSN